MWLDLFSLDLHKLRRFLRLGPNDLFRRARKFSIAISAVIEDFLANDITESEDSQTCTAEYLF